MKNKENKKWSFAHFCAYISLALSFTMLVLWCCNAGGLTVVSLDSFVGVIVALLAIVVTLAIAWQIYSSIELKNKIEELNELRHKLNVQEEESKRQVFHLNSLIFGSLAEVDFTRRNYVSAFSYLMTSLEADMLLDIPRNSITLLEKMEYAVSQITSKVSLDVERFGRIKSSNDVISESKHYNMIKKRYEKVYNEFISKVRL
ncbi:MAG: hypothetical protein J6K01_00185 [Paludibacteraceae bacterium]|nr:hypothetical protein [Paludibacteraceae bacterium]